jgi:hypothetical protein
MPRIYSTKLIIRIIRLSDKFLASESAEFMLYRLAILLSLIAVWAAPGFSQVEAGRIVGAVTDPNRAIVSQALKFNF